MHKIFWSNDINWDKLKVPFFILLLKEVKLKWYNINSKTNFFLYILLAFTNFSKNNKSNKNIFDNGDYNIFLNILLENALINDLSFLFFWFQIFIFSNFLNIIKFEQLL